MGVKEEEASRKLIKGYSYQLCPTQGLAGNCTKCKKEVWVKGESVDKKLFSGVDYIHFGCTDLPSLVSCKPISSRTKKYANGK